MNTDPFNRRLGCFEIPLLYLDHNHMPVQRIMSRCIIVRAEVLYHARAIRYTAISGLFDVVPDHQMPPDYSITFDADGNIQAEAINAIERLA